MGYVKAAPAIGGYARQLIEEFPNISNLQGARLLMQRYPAAFASQDAARSAMRRVRGALGKKNRQLTIGKLPRTSEDAATCKRWGFVPDADPNPWRQHSLPKDIGKWLIIADLHMPYHDKAAVTMALEYGRRQDCDGLILLGDVPDCYQLSRYIPDPNQRKFTDEIGLVRSFLDGLHKRFRRIVWKAGNHEFRLERYLLRRAPELFGIEAFSFPSFLDLGQRGVQWIPPMDPIVVGRLTLLHGHEWPAGTSTPVNPARTAFLKATACVLVAHQHRTSEHTEQTLEGTTVTCWSIGALCDMHPQYRPIANKWNLGLAILDMTSKSWRVENRRIVEGEVV